VKGLGRLRGAERELPTTRVKRGDVDVTVYTTGELRPINTAMMVAPSVGSSIRIVYLAKTGTRVKKGDLVVELDPSDQQYNLEQARYDFNQAQEAIAKAKSDAAVQSAQDQVDLLTATFDVRRAELEVSRNELVSAIDAQKNQLNLEEAKRRLDQLKQDIQSRSVSNQSSVAVAQEKLAKARLSMDQAQKNIDSMQLRSTLDGLVAVQENRGAAGQIGFMGMPLPDFHEGDEVQPGSFIAKVLDVDQMEIQGKVSETDRANLSAGTPAEVHIYALSGTEIKGKVKTVAGMAMRNMFGMGGGVSKFDVIVQLDKPAPELMPGLSAEIEMSGGLEKSVLYLPPQAVFEKDGGPVVYLRAGKRFESKKIKIARRSESRVVVEGLDEGAEVALVDPEKQNRKSATPAGPLSQGLQGGGR